MRNSTTETSNIAVRDAGLHGSRRRSLLEDWSALSLPYPDRPKNAFVASTGSDRQQTFQSTPPNTTPLGTLQVQQSGAAAARDAARSHVHAPQMRSRRRRSLRGVSARSRRFPTPAAARVGRPQSLDARLAALREGLCPGDAAPVGFGCEVGQDFVVSKPSGSTVPVRVS